MLPFEDVDFSLGQTCHLAWVSKGLAPNTQAGAMGSALQTPTPCAPKHGPTTNHLQGNGPAWAYSLSLILLILGGAKQGLEAGDGKASWCGLRMLGWVTLAGTGEAPFLKLL